VILPSGVDQYGMGLLGGGNGWCEVRKVMVAKTDRFFPSHVRVQEHIFWWFYAD